jgi:Aspartyl protease
LNGMRFPYTPVKTAAPVWSLAGRSERPRPILSVALIGPAGTASKDALLDTGADDTVFSEDTATLIGIDLNGAPAGTAAGVGGAVLPLRYAQVVLRLTDGKEFREWPALVGFTPVAMKRGLLGFAGCLQFFTAIFLGDTEQVELSTNSLYPGT